jgi:hypothetical protein
MKKSVYLFLVLAAFFGFSSCEEEKEGAPTVASVKIASSALFGDSIPFTVSIGQGKEKLSSVKVQIYYSDAMVSETFVPTNDAGDCSGKVSVPYYPNMPLSGAKATVRFVVKDRVFDFSEHRSEIALTYPEFSQLTFVSTGGEYAMTKDGGNPFGFKTSGVFPFRLKGYFVAPPAGEHGTTIRFGLKNGRIEAGGKDSIVFQGAFPDACDVTFDAYTCEASPMVDFTEITFADTDENRTAELSLQQNKDLLISGISDYNSWWVNPAFFSKNADGTLKFKAIDGLYRISADFTLKYFSVEPLNSSGLPAVFDPLTGEGCIWVNGNSAVGIPSYSANNTNWNSAKSFAMAPVGNRKYQLYLTAGTQLNPSNVNFKCYGQTGSWDYEFNDTRIIASTAYFRIDTSSGNLGNIRAGATALQSGKTYILTVDASSIPVVLTAVIDE